MPPKVVCDACVLYPIRLCDLFIRMHLQEVITLRWSQKIHDEWVRNLIVQKPEHEEKIRYRSKCMQRTVDDWEINGFEYLVDKIMLPDPGDRHVLAAAIHTHADYLVTSNLKDFGDKSAWRGVDYRRLLS